MCVRESVCVCACVGMGVFMCAQAHLKVCAPCLEAQGGGQLVFPAFWLQLGEKAVSWAQVCCYLGAGAAGLLPSPLMGPLLAPGDPPADPAQAAAAQCPAEPPVPGDQLLPNPASLPGHRLQAPPPPAGGAAGPQCRARCEGLGFVVPGGRAGNSDAGWSQAQRPQAAP